MKPRIVIVGAGLGGCFVAHGLAETHDVTMVEVGAGSVTALQERIEDIGAPALVNPHIGTGLGGTTALWHNAMIEVDTQLFDERWPFSKSELEPFYAQAFPILAGASSEIVRREIATLRQRYLSMGLPDLGLPGLFYPRARRNAWKILDLERRVRLVTGEVVALEPDGTRIRHLTVRVPGGSTRVIEGDAFVLAAGGLGTPLLLQQLAANTPLPSLAHAGFHYEDHPMGFVGELTMRVPLYRIWNFDAPGTGGNIRMPLVVMQDGLRISFQIRPAANFYRQGRRDRVHSVVTDIRNNRFNPLGYLRLLAHWDDVLDILSFEFGIRIPTSRYSLLMMAEQPPSEECAVARGIGPAGRATIERNHRLTPAYLKTLDGAIAQLLDRLGPLATNVTVFPNWRATLGTGAHHSGTARMSVSPATGVCDADARVHGLDNLFIADGSVVPASGIANTGLTIASLGLRLAKHLSTSTVAGVAHRDHGSHRTREETVTVESVPQACVRGHSHARPPLPSRNLEGVPVRGGAPEPAGGRGIRETKGAVVYFDRCSDPGNEIEQVRRPTS